MTLFRDNDLTRVTLLVRLTPGRAPNKSENWNTHERIDIGYSQLHKSGNSATSEHYNETEKFIEAASKAITAHPTNPSPSASSSAERRKLRKLE